jgi:hypothetical protein
MEYPDAPAWAAALEASAWGVAMRDSSFLYPLANVLHVLGLILLIGPILVLDLRLLGVGRGIALPPAYTLLSGFSRAGVALMLLTGFSLFAADARPLSGSTVLWVKWGLIAVGLANAVWFQVRWRARLATWDADPPAAGRVQAAASLALWLAVAVCGRLLAYL